MKKYSYLIIIVLISSLVLTGCLLSNVGQVPATDQSGITYLTKSPGTDLFTDDFESYTLGTYPGGVGLGDWKYVSGIPSIVLDTTQVLGIVGGSYVGEAVAVTGSLSWQDYSLDLDVKKHSGTYFNIVVRYVDSGTYYLLEPSSDTTHIALFKRVSGGTFTELAPRPLQSTVTGTWYHYRIELRTTLAGTNIKVFVNGVNKFDVTDNTPALATGSVGVGGYAGSEGRFDNVLVTDVTAVGSITINSDEPYTNSTSVILNLTATDAVGVTGYRVVNGTDASSGTIIDVSSTTSFSNDIPWNLDSGDGTKMVAVQYRDTILKWSPNYTDSIILDQTPPVVTITAPVANAEYTLNQSVLADWTATDALSGIFSAVGTVASGSSIDDTGTVGTKTFTVTATDNAGNETMETVKYYVIYNFFGFFSPVDNHDVVNLVKAGSAIPVKFSLSGNKGLNIFATDEYPKSVMIACSTGAPIDAIEATVTAGGSSLNYDDIADQYIYVWKTDKIWAGTCRQLEVKLNDGFTHIAYFKFK